MWLFIDRCIYGRFINISDIDCDGDGSTITRDGGRKSNGGTKGTKGTRPTITRGDGRTTAPTRSVNNDIISRFCLIVKCSLCHYLPGCAINAKSIRIITGKAVYERDTICTGRSNRCADIDPAVRVFSNRPRGSAAFCEHRRTVFGLFIDGCVYECFINISDIDCDINRRNTPLRIRRCNCNAITGLCLIVKYNTRLQLSGCAINSKRIGISATEAVCECVTICISCCNRCAEISADVCVFSNRPCCAAAFREHRDIVFGLFIDGCIYGCFINISDIDCDVDRRTAVVSIICCNCETIAGFCLIVKCSLCY